MSVAAAFAARVAVDAAAAGSAVEVDGGVLLSTPELPAIWDLNALLLAPGADTARLLRALHELPDDVRRVTAFDPADPVGPERGWTLSHCLLLVAGDPPPDGPAEAAPVDPRELREVQVRAWDAEGGEGGEGGDQLAAMLDRFAAQPGYRTVAARVDGELAAWAAIANGCIDDVWVQPAHRGRGLGRAVTRAALAAGGWFLWTESTDPVPQGLYRSLGMRDAGTVVQLTRDPG